MFRATVAVPSPYRSRLACLIMLIAVPGCRMFHQEPKSTDAYSTSSPAETHENAKASRLNRRGLKHFHRGQFDLAEKMFREALQVDISYAPAHNNLGQVYLARHQLYLAAWEFEYAANLMPERVEPIINQGLAYEMAGRTERAILFYRRAYDRQPTHPWAISSLVRTIIKQNGDPSEIRFLLDELVLHDHRQEWVEWAELLLETQYSDNCIACGDGPAFLTSGDSIPYSSAPDGIFEPLPSEGDWDSSNAADASSSGYQNAPGYQGELVAPLGAGIPGAVSPGMNGSGDAIQNGSNSDFRPAPESNLLPEAGGTEPSHGPTEPRDEDLIRSPIRVESLPSWLNQSKVSPQSPQRLPSTRLPRPDMGQKLGVGQPQGVLNGAAARFAGARDPKSDSSLNPASYRKPSTPTLPPWALPNSMGK